MEWARMLVEACASSHHWSRDAAPQAAPRISAVSGGKFLHTSKVALS
jgi:hypothetical protein